MYWIRTNSLIDIVLYLLLCSGWAIGGYLLVRTAFHLRRSERVLSGMGVGFLLFIGISNLFAHILQLTVAYWCASLLIFVVGVICAWRSNIQPWLEKRDLHFIPLLIGLVFITVLFTLILRSESIFDDYQHLPLVSIMAAGDIPPHFYLNPDFYFAYHYGLQVFAASLVRLAGFFPWSAWDISRAFTIAFTLVLGWVWVRRVTRSRVAAWLGTILFTFGGGTRWLLLFLPAKLSAWVSHSITLVGTGHDTAATLMEALQKTWMIEGAGIASFPFAFHNGIFVPVFFTLGSTAAMPFMTVLLLLLLLPRRRFSTAGLIIWSVLFSTLALSAEHFFVVIWIGVAVTLIISMIYHKKLFKLFPKDIFVQWVTILTISALLSLVQGGFVTETARNLIASISGTVSHSYNARGFSIRWPPGLLSAHLGSLSIFIPGQLVALLAELGLALLLVPLIFTRFRKELIHKDWFFPGLSISVILSLVFPLLFQYELDRSITRMPATALWISMVLGFPILWMALPHLKTIFRVVLAIGYVIMILGGMVIFLSQLISIRHQELSYFIENIDAGYAVDYWNKLPEGAQVLDRVPERSVTIFGRITRANSGIYDSLPEWEALITNPDPTQIAAAGYDYVYMDKIWWDSLTPAQRANFEQPCISVVDERKQNDSNDYRLLIDVAACKKP
jgi:hypothetical protein